MGLNSSIPPPKKSYGGTPKRLGFSAPNHFRDGLLECRPGILTESVLCHDAGQPEGKRHATDHEAGNISGAFLAVSENLRTMREARDRGEAFPIARVSIEERVAVKASNLEHEYRHHGYEITEGSESGDNDADQGDKQTDQSLRLTEPGIEEAAAMSQRPTDQFSIPDEAPRPVPPPSPDQRPSFLRQLGASLGATTAYLITTGACMLVGTWLLAHILKDAVAVRQFFVDGGGDWGELIDELCPLIAGASDTHMMWAAFFLVVALLVVLGGVVVAIRSIRNGIEALANIFHQWAIVVLHLPPHESRCFPARVSRWCRNRILAPSP